MRREGRQHGWVYAFQRSLVDPEGKRRAVHPLEGAATANGGFVRAPRKPTNHSKFTGGHARFTGHRAARDLIGKRSGAASGKGTHKFKHDEVRTYLLDLGGAGDAAADAYDDDE
ncbi:hypothetical protein ACP70R_038233 [Stipagrostis hirtigluma subsp. patula]